MGEHMASADRAGSVRTSDLFEHLFENPAALERGTAAGGALGGEASQEQDE